MQSVLKPMSMAQCRPKDSCSPSTTTTTISSIGSISSGSSMRVVPDRMRRRQKRFGSRMTVFAAGQVALDSAEDSVRFSALDRAKLLIMQEEVDSATLEAALAGLDEEMVRTQEAVAEAESCASTMESTGVSAKEQLLRLNADFENFRRKTGDEKAAIQDSVRGDIANSLLPVIDTFERARTSVKAETDNEIKINNSYQGLYKQFSDFLKSLGVEAIPTVGKQFDSDLHEAVARVEDSSAPAGTVIEECLKGFTLRGKVLRRAQVKVSSPNDDVATETSDK